jgi:phosphogluconate dehydratase
LVWEPATERATRSEVFEILFAQPFATGGGLHVMKGNLGRGIAKLCRCFTRSSKLLKPLPLFLTTKEDFFSGF